MPALSMRSAPHLRSTSVIRALTSTRTGSSRWRSGKDVTVSIRVMDLYVGDCPFDPEPDS